MKATNYLAFLAILVMCSGSSLAAEKHKQRHHKSSKSSSDSCCKSIKKELKSIAKKHRHKECCEAACITQKEINKAGGQLLLTKSGNYTLKEDVVGTLLVAADSVCIDLCCHTLNAGGTASAIIASGRQGLEVFNGRIINASDSGVLILGCTAVELYDLTMSSHALDAIREENSTDLSVHDVNFLNNNSGERALNFNTCDNISVKYCNASGFLSTIGAVMEFDTCNAVSMADVDVTNCTKTSEAGAYFFTAPTAFVFVGGPGIPSVDTIVGCTGVHFERVRVNNNTFNNINPATDPDMIGMNWRTAEAIFFLNSNSCSLTQCETSNNTDIAGNLATEDTEDYLLCTLQCSDFIINEHQSNNNQSLDKTFYFAAISALDSYNMIFDGCQANNSFVQALDVSASLGTARCWGYALLVYFGIQPTQDMIVRNCQGNFNTVADGGSGREVVGAKATVTGLHMQAENGAGGYLVENSQFNNNSMQTKGALQRVRGIVPSGVFPIENGVQILNSTADNNTGGEWAVGIACDTFNSIVIDGCSASSNEGYGVEFGILPPGAIQVNDSAIINCVMNKNGHATPDDNGIWHEAAGIWIPDLGLTPNQSNFLIKGCQIFDTFTGSALAAGINVAAANNVVIEDCEIFNTITTDTAFQGQGILFNNMTDSKIIRSQFHANQNSGIELEGDNSTIAIIECVAMDNDIGINFASGSTASCSLVQDSRALNNATAGFSYNISAAPTSLTVTFIGNEAQCNGECVDDNFENLTTRINLQQLSWTNGGITAINPVGPGAAAIGARFTNLQQGPACSPP